MFSVGYMCENEVFKINNLESNRAVIQALISLGLNKMKSKTQYMTHTDVIITANYYHSVSVNFFKIPNCGSVFLWLCESSRAE